jgi:hypothetical protein
MSKFDQNYDRLIIAIICGSVERSRAWETVSSEFDALLKTQKHLNQMVLVSNGAGDSMTYAPSEAGCWDMRKSDSHDE